MSRINNNSVQALRELHSRLVASPPHTRPFVKDAQALGLHWILAFIVIAALTVTTCMKQQQMLLAKASSHTMVFALKQSGKEIR